MLNANGSLSPSESTIAPSSMWSIPTLIRESIPSFFKNMPSSCSPCGSPPMPKWPRNGSDVT